MAALDMLPAKKTAKTLTEPFVARSSHWVRAPVAGLLRARVSLGALVEAGQKIGSIADPLGIDDVSVRAERSGIVIGRSELPLANEGDGLFHVATFARLAEVSASVEEFHSEIEELT